MAIVEILAEQQAVEVEVVIAVNTIGLHMVLSAVILRGMSMV